MGAFRDTVVKQAVRLANETATAAAARAKASAGAPPPARPPSCADKYCIYLALRPMFEEGDGLCICTFSYLAPAAAAARRGRGAMLLSLLGSLMMAAGFGVLSQRASYWLGVTAPAEERARVAAGLFGGDEAGGVGRGDEEGGSSSEGMMRPKGGATATATTTRGLLSSGSLKAPSATTSVHASGAAGAGATTERNGTGPHPSSSPPAPPQHVRRFFARE